MKTAIITYYWSDLSYKEAFDKVVIPRLDFLAKKWNSELIVCNNFNENIKNENWPQDYELNKYNKCFILKELVGKFDKVLCIDSDIVLSKEMPNIFQIYEDGYFYAVLDGAKGDQYCFHRIEEMIACQAMLGSINWTYGYYNTGFMILEKEHKIIFQDENYKIFLNFSDQTKINYYLRKYKIPHRSLSKEYNSMAINCIDSKLSPKIVNLVPPDILSHNVYAAHAAAIPKEIKNDYIFRLDALMS
jgi:lipopolysaccharide biosynthesis glycosyltransferase